MSDETARPVVVYHVAAMGDWRDVVREQLGVLADAGFGVPGDPVRLTFVGRGLDWFRDTAARFGVCVELVKADENTDHYETFAMLEVERLAKVEKTTRPVLYLHTKGVSNPGDLHKRRWRILMEEHVIGRWRELVGVLAAGSHDVAGVGWWSSNEPHFSGNFWLASADYLRRLPDYVTYHRSKNFTRYSCEFWIGSAHGARPFECFHSNQQFWQGWYDLKPHTESITKLPDAAPVLNTDGPDARPELVVLTACSRPGNLPAVGWSLRGLQKYFRLRWVIVADTSKTTPTACALAVPEFLREFIQVFGCAGSGRGVEQKNHGLGFIRKTFPDAWVYTLDDDNAVHPSFPTAAAGAVARWPAAGVLVFPQVHGDGSHRLDAGPVQHGRIDAGSFLFRPTIADSVYVPLVTERSDDWGFVSDMWDKVPEKFRFVHAGKTFYNKVPPFFVGNMAPVPCLQNPWEFNELVGLVSLHPSESPTIAEIGSYYGGTLYHWLRMGMVERVVSIDWPPNTDPILHGDYLAACRAQWPTWAAARGGVEFHTIEGDSAAPDTVARVSAALGAGPQIDFLFIDGDHSTEAVLRDFAAYLPLMRPHGIVAFHDVVGIPQVAAAWRQIKAGRRTYEISAGVNAWGIGVVFLGDSA